MVNVNKIKIIIIDLVDGELPPFELFEMCEYDQHNLVGLITLYKSTLTKLADYNYTVYDIPSGSGEVDIKVMSDVNNMLGVVEDIKEYIGINMSIDDILDIILESNISRRFYLESYLYYKSTQEGKPINEFTIRVNFYDDFIHFLSEDIISDEVLSSNDDFSESTVKIETYLTKSEMIIKFREYLVGIVE
jgi:hypothetical protein